MAIVYRGPVCETMERGRVSIKGGINHDTISSHSVPGRGGREPKARVQCSSVAANALLDLAECN